MKRNLRNYFGMPTGKAQDTGKVSGKGTNDGGETEATEGGFKVDFGSMNIKQRSKSARRENIRSKLKRATADAQKKKAAQKRKGTGGKGTKTLAPAAPAFRMPKHRVFVGFAARVGKQGDTKGAFDKKAIEALGFLQKELDEQVCFLPREKFKECPPI